MHADGGKIDLQETKNGDVCSFSKDEYKPSDGFKVTLTQGQYCDCAQAQEILAAIGAR